MAWTTKPARFNLRLVRAVRKALAKGKEPVLPVVSHRHLVARPEGGSATTFDVCLVLDDDGTAMATRHELPDVLVFHDSQEQALAEAQAAFILSAPSGHSSQTQSSLRHRGDLTTETEIPL